MCVGVADQMRESSIDRPMLDSSDTKLCRNSRGVQAAASSPAAAPNRRKGPPYVGRVQLTPEARGEHQIHVDPPLPRRNRDLQLLPAVEPQHLHTTTRHLKSAPRLLGLGITASAHRSPERNNG